MTKDPVSVSITDPQTYSPLFLMQNLKCEDLLQGANSDLIKLYQGQKFVSKMLDLSRPSDVLICNSVHPGQV